MRSDGHRLRFVPDPSGRRRTGGPLRAGSPRPGGREKPGSAGILPAWKIGAFGPRQAGSPRSREAGGHRPSIVRNEEGQRGAGYILRGNARHVRENHHDHVPFPHPGARPHDPSVRPLVRDDPGRPRRGRSQGRTTRSRRRHAGHPPVRRGRERTVHAMEPQQALRRPRPQERGRSRDLQAARGHRRRADRELQAGNRGPDRRRLRRHARPQSAARLLLHLGLRPDRPLCPARGGSTSSRAG